MQTAGPQCMPGNSGMRRGAPHSSYNNMADGQGVKRGIKAKAASRAFQSNYSDITEFLTPAVEWAPRLRAKGMISRSTSELATNQAAFASEQSKAIQMLQDLDRYIRSSNADFFWHLVYMINEKERAQEGGGTLAQNLAVAYKNKGGGDEIDSAVLSDHERDGPERCLSEQPTSGVPPHPDSTARSQSDPLSVAVQESDGAPGVQMLVASSPVENSCPSLPYSQQEQGAGSLDVRFPEEERGTDPQEVSEENQQRQSPEGNSPSPPPSSLPQVGGAQGGGAQVGGAHGGGVPEDGVVRRKAVYRANDEAEKKPRNDQHTTPKSAVSSPSRAEGGSTNWTYWLACGTLAVIFLGLCGAIVWGCWDKLGGGNKVEDNWNDDWSSSVHPCSGIQLDFTQSQPLMRILEEELISHYSDDWDQVGSQLQVPSAKLTALDKDNPNVMAKMREVIRFWLKGNGREPHTLGTLVAAVDKSNLPKAAERLRSHPELCKERATTE